MARTTLALLLALAAARAPAQGLTGPPPDARPPAAAPAEGAPGAPGTGGPRGGTLQRGAVLEEVSGVVREVDRRAQRIAIEAGAERVTLSLDRNTMVYTPAGLGTMLDIVPGARIRAGRNAEFLAYWVQVRAEATTSQEPGPAGATRAGAPAAPPPGSGGAKPVTPEPGTAAQP